MLGKLLGVAFSVILALNLLTMIALLSLAGPLYTGDYESENINLVAKIHRANFIGGTLIKQIENDNKKSLPVVILELSQVSDYPVRIRSGDPSIYIFMTGSSLNGFTKEETRAVIAHELGHYMLGHRDDNGIKSHIEADIFALQYVDRETLARAIIKFSRNDQEREQRLKAIGAN